ncbi:MAG TPA: hypothetical protein VM778_02775 [Gemmatimonadota bacterium]|nr:hypothetical protein [Gemmatimonadota bacterium]
MTSLRAVTPMRRPPSLYGVPPRYQVFDRRKSPPMSVGRLYFDPGRDAVVIEVYDDPFREFLKREEPFAGKRFDWILDVEPDAPSDARDAIIRTEPLPIPARHDGTEALTLEEAVEALSSIGHYRVVKASDPL